MKTKASKTPSKSIADDQEPRVTTVLLQKKKKAN